MIELLQVQRKIPLLFLGACLTASPTAKHFDRARNSNTLCSSTDAMPHSTPASPHPQSTTTYLRNLSAARVWLRLFALLIHDADPHLLAGPPLLWQCLPRIRPLYILVEGLYLCFVHACDDPAVKAAHQNPRHAVHHAVSMHSTLSRTSFANFFLAILKSRPGSPCTRASTFINLQSANQSPASLAVLILMRCPDCTLHGPSSAS